MYILCHSIQCDNGSQRKRTAWKRKTEVRKERKVENISVLRSSAISRWQTSGHDSTPTTVIRSFIHCEEYLSQLAHNLCYLEDLHTISMSGLPAGRDVLGMMLMGCDSKSPGRTVLKSLALCSLWLEQLCCLWSIERQPPPLRGCNGHRRRC